ncbi:translation machinery-associated protein 20 [Nadsonia fulvescens var. elongata DSM 6958]|uniref:Translation machinery-associated protein 20 n=1 Tax=Nadsonia fulvescens var. elongata DSM 6958 TaxID=857566 RepID=A0A1E3PMD1_9ASCO|nr:translation machinery-associated protein 20 [Nadsonia fulvescens var. elongata DSM 6958]
MPNAMFKKFSREEVHSRSNIKSSVQRGLKAKLIEQFPGLESVIEEAMPKKSQMVQIKCSDKVTLYSINSEVLFFQSFDDPLVPTIKFVHKYPEAFPRVKVDRGAIKFVLSGANIMCPGLTSPGASLPESPGLDVGAVVSIYAENKEHALAVGVLTMSTEDIKSINKNCGVEVCHYLGDGLWNFSE